MAEITLIVDEMLGEIVVEDKQDLTAETVEYLQKNLGEAREIASTRPLEIIESPKRANYFIPGNVKRLNDGIICRAFVGNSRWNKSNLDDSPRRLRQSSDILNG